MCSIGWIRALFLFLPGNGWAKTAVVKCKISYNLGQDNIVKL